MTERSGVGYLLGQLFAKLSKWVLIIGAVLIVAPLAITSCMEGRKKDAEMEANRQQVIAKSAAKRAELAKLAEDRKQACTQDIDEVIARARAAIKANTPEVAKVVVGACDGLSTDARLSAVVADAQAAIKARDGRRAREAKEQADRAQREDLAQRKREGVRLGMSKDDVIKSSWGRPERINRTTTVNGEREQWVYGLRNYLYFDNGVLTGIQN